MRAGLALRRALALGLLAGLLFACQRVHHYYTLAGQRGPRSSSGVPLVVHQTWMTQDVPSSLAEYVLSWMKYQPTWKYRFWTDEDIEAMVDQDYPELRQTFDGYRTPIFRADVMRYMLLYAHGGIYADLDVESLRPLTALLDTYPCILAQEMPLHKSYYSEGFISNAIMICKPRHPFFRFVLDLLPRRNYYRDVLRATGPLMLERALRKFLDVAKIQDRYHGVWLEQAQIYVAPWYMFMPTYDPMRIKEYYTLCNQTLYDSKGKAKAKYETDDERALPGLVQQCRHLEATGWVNEPWNTSLTDHHWVHTYGANYIAYHDPYTETINVTEIMSTMLL